MIVIDGALAAAALLTGAVLNAVVGRWWGDPLSALVILVYGLSEARHAWGQAGCTTQPGAGSSWMRARGKTGRSAIR